MDYTGFGGGFDEDAEYEHPLSSLEQNDETTFHQKQDLENNAIGNIFGQHYIHRRKMTPIDDEEPRDHDEHAFHMLDDAYENIKEHVNDILKVGKTAPKIISNSAKLIKTIESSSVHAVDPVMEKYSRLANESYLKFEKKAKQVSNFKRVDSIVDSIDNVLLEAEDEVHISFRGTMKGSDWVENNSKIMNKTLGDMRKTKRYFEAEKDMQSAIKYAKSVGKKLTAAGHSLGAHLSYDLSQKYDIEGYHYQPAISTKQVEELRLGKWLKNSKPQKMFRTSTDVVSVRTVTNKKLFNNGRHNVKVETVHTKPKFGNSLTKSHGLEHFESDLKTPLKAVRNDAKTAFKNGLSTAFGVGIQGAFTAYDIYNDVNKKESGGAKAVDITTDIGKNTAQFFGDNAIMAAGMAAAPETMGLSLIPAFMTSYLFNVASENLTHEIQGTLKHAPKDIERAMNKAKKSVVKKANVVGNEVKNDANVVVKGWKKAGNEIKHDANKKAKAIRHFFGF